MDSKGLFENLAAYLDFLIEFWSFRADGLITADQTHVDPSLVTYATLGVVLHAFFSAGQVQLLPDEHGGKKLWELVKTESVRMISLSLLFASATHLSVRTWDLLCEDDLGTIHATINAGLMFLAAAGPLAGGLARALRSGSRAARSAAYTLLLASQLWYVYALAATHDTTLLNAAVCVALSVIVAMVLGMVWELAATHTGQDEDLPEVEAREGDPTP